MRLWKNLLVDIVMALVIGLFLLLIVVPRFFPLNVATILTGSMEPNLPQGALVLALPVNPTAVEVGDIIVFKSGKESSTVVSHRVIEVSNNGGLFFTTKGDANENPDPAPVPAGNVKGKVVFHVPYLGGIFGAVSGFVRSRAGFAILVIIPTVLILVSTGREIAHQGDFRQKRLELIQKRRRQWKTSTR